jgi:hypothetical protein
MKAIQKPDKNLIMGFLSVFVHILTRFLLREMRPAGALAPASFRWTKWRKFYLLSPPTPTP